MKQRDPLRDHASTATLDAAAAAAGGDVHVNRRVNTRHLLKFNFTFRAGECWSSE